MTEEVVHTRGYVTKKNHSVLVKGHRYIEGSQPRAWRKALAAYDRVYALSHVCNVCWRLGSARIKYESMFMFFTELCICVIFIHINEYEIKVVINVFLER